METSQRVQCGWCQFVIQDGVEPTSHGICDRCSRKLLMEALTTPAHKITRYAVDSSNVKAIGYDEGICVVEFGNGHLYAYAMLPIDFEKFAAAESKGRYFNQEIRGKVSGEKLTGQCVDCGETPAVIVEPCPNCGGTVRAIDKTHKADV